MYYEEAAIGGHAAAIYNLAAEVECRKDRESRRSVGSSPPTLDAIFHSNSQRILFVPRGKMSNEDFAAALRSHQAAVDAMKSLEITVAIHSRSRPGERGT
eukprot:scaffold4802_cov96-Skeletonema_dohrnii-CCMP3373.AAC.1